KTIGACAPPADLKVRATAAGVVQAFRPACPKCGCDDESMLERVDDHRWFCNTCSHDWPIAPPTRAREFTLEAEQQSKFSSLEDLIARSGLRRDEVVTLADIGALNSFGYDRRSALWQAERAVRPTGELFEEEFANLRPQPSPEA